MKTYIGNSLQLSGAYEYRLCGGKGDSMRILRVKNGKGLDFEISLDRCGDICTLLFDGVNMGYMSPCGYVHPSYTVNRELEFLKSFTAGFFTTCGLTSVGSPCEDNGEALPLHGTISSTPSERYSVEETDSEIVIKVFVRDAAIFAHQLLLERTYTVSKTKNTVILKDKVMNIGPVESPVMLLYHCNMGYPLLTEKSILKIPSNGILPRNEHAKSDIENCLTIEKPQNGYEEMCFYHNVKETNGYGRCSIFNPEIKKGLVMKFNKNGLDFFTEWKMMGEYEYVLGLEPGNCTPDGRDVMRRKNALKFISPNEAYNTEVNFEFVRDAESAEV